MGRLWRHRIVCHLVAPNQLPNSRCQRKTVINADNRTRFTVSRYAMFHPIFHEKYIDLFHFNKQYSEHITHLCLCVQNHIHAYRFNIVIISFINLSKCNVTFLFQPLLSPEGRCCKKFGIRSYCNKNIMSVCMLKQTIGGTLGGFTNVKSTQNMSRSEWKCSTVHKHLLNQPNEYFPHKTDVGMPNNPRPL